MNYGRLLEEFMEFFRNYWVRGRFLESKFHSGMIICAVTFR